jgi:bifunctional DNA-binding transcriptional regulator/antitoxin component of YhaV-PrlF toxin-antitoxin module
MVKVLCNVYDIGTNSLAITIPMNLREIFGIEAGDTLNIEFNKEDIFKKTKLNKETKDSQNEKKFLFK